MYSPLTIQCCGFAKMKRNAQSSIDESDKVKRVMTPSAVFRPLSENWCVSTSHIDRFDFEWNIQHFAHLTKDKTYYSTQFKNLKGSQNLKWRLELYIRDEEVHVSLTQSDRYWLCHVNIYRFKMAIVNQSRANAKINVQLENLVGFKISESQACSYLMSDGSFTICCEIQERIEGEIQSNGDMVASGKQFQLINGFDQLERLFEDMTLSDVTLNVNGRQFKAHKCILASNSQVFLAMFEHPTKENITNQVVIEDIEPEVFQELLRFIYTGRLSSPVTLDTMATRLFVAADKYLLDRLKSECEIHLLRRMSADNCIEFLKLNISDQIHPTDNLKQGAIDFFRRFPVEVMSTDGWKKTKQEHPNHPVWSFILEIM
jgi:speckle-type POZ protein